MRMHSKLLIRAAFVVTLAILTAAPAASGAGFAAPHLTASPAAEDPSYGASIDVGPTGDLAALWIRSLGTPTVARVAVRPAGGSFAAADASATGQPLMNYAGSSSIGIDASGQVYAFFIRSNGSNSIAQVATKNPGGAWSGATNLSAAGADVTSLHGSVNSDGDAVAAWVRGTTYQTSYRPSGGAWESATSPAGATGTPQDPPLTAINADGDAAVTWGRIPAGTWLADLVYRPSAGPFAAPNLSVASNAGTDRAQPSVGLDAAGNSTVLYKNWPVGSQGLLAKTRASSNGAITTATLVANNAANSFNSPRIAVNENGDAVAVWERVVGGDTLIQVSQRTGTGGAWNVTPIDLTATGSGTSSNPRVALDNQGNALVVWTNGTTVQAAFRKSGTSNFTAFPAVATGAQPDVALASDGNGAIVYNTTAAPSEVKVAQFDPNPPVITGFSPPAGGATGSALGFTATATDFWDAAPDIAWSFGDGASGPNGTHIYTTPGTYTVTVTATDDAGNASAQSAVIVVAAGAPQLSGLKVSPTSFRAATRGGSIAAAGAKVSFNITLDASVKFTVQRPARGVKKNGRCVAPPKKGASKLKGCTRYRSVGSFSKAAKLGANSFRFTGRLRSKKLKAGKYRLLAVGTTNGNAGNSATKSFRVKR